MLRNIFVFGIILIGIAFAFQGPFYVLLFYLWDAYFRPELWVWGPYVQMLDLSFWIGLILVMSSFNAVREFRLTRQTALIALFFAQSVVSLIASEHFDWSLAWWTDFAKVQIITLSITFLVIDRRRYRLALIVVAYSLGFEQAKEGWAQMVLNPGAANNNPIPFLGDNNGVAVGMMMLAPVFVALAQTANSRWERYLHQFFVIGVVYRGISTYSRGGFITAGAIGLMALWYSPRKVRAIVSVAVLAGIIVSVMPQKFWDRMNTITAPQDEQDASAQSRMFFWGIAVRMADAKPMTGVGFNGSERSFSRYDTSGGAYGGGRAVHSAWFGVLADMGYPGLVLMAAIIVNALHSAWRIRRKTRGDPALRDLRAYATAMQMTLVAYIVGNTFLSGQYNEMFWHFVGFGVALERVYGEAVVLAAAPASAPAIRSGLGINLPKAATAGRLEPGRQP
jgi:probable O-glycosylation ligase (exosortase A-associated)